MRLFPYIRVNGVYSRSKDDILILRLWMSPPQCEGTIVDTSQKLEAFLTSVNCSTSATNTRIYFNKHASLPYHF